MNSLRDHALVQANTSNGVVPSEVLYVTECSHWGELGFKAVQAVFPSAQAVFWSAGMPKPDLNNWHGDWIISFKSDLILSRDVLERARKGAINFHPSPPKYRGLGGYWWAIHNRDEDFGVTCHHMNERIDHGEIISTESFPILPGETVATLKHRAAVHSLRLLHGALDDIVSERPLVPCGVHWERHLYTSKELELAQQALAANSDRRAATSAIKSLDAKRALGALNAIQGSIIDLRDEATEALVADRAAKPKLALG